ncbi:MAG TPA: AI-2E family transporter [Candidatus Saccharimonadales bacterium]|nr:AI-2E family transporter [Candidatus Saccharimonadales bacterium]
MPDDASLRNTALRTWISFLVVVGGLLTLLFLYTIRPVLLQLLIALILAIALSPLNKLLMRRGLNRIGASVVTLLITVLVLIGIVGAIASPLITQGDELVNNAPKLIEQATASGPLQQLDQRFNYTERLQEFTGEIPRLLTANSGQIAGIVGSVFNAVSTTAVILVMVLFMLIEGPTAWAQFIRLLGRKQGAFVDDVARKIIHAVGGFVSGNLFISLIAGVVTLITLLIAGVPYAFALAALVAVFDLIPLVGATIATIFVALVALSQGVVIALIVTAVLLIYQFVEGNVIQPIVYGKAVRLSQLLIVVATIIGALLGGIIGVLLAIPVAAAVQIIIVELLRANGAQLEPEVAGSVKK